MHITESIYQVFLLLHRYLQKNNTFIEKYSHQKL